ncbi:MAG: D-amino-acid transaminase [Herpetosiphon sp.]
MIVYINNQWHEHTDPVLSIQDRAVQWADALYEVVHIYDSRYFRLELHIQRLQNGLNALRIPWDASSVVPIFDELLRRNPPLERGMIYLQISRGVAPRIHGLPPTPHPTVIAYAQPVTPNVQLRRHGGRAVFVEDRRWLMCHLKTTGLLLNAMAKQEARDLGADDAIFHRSGTVTEASSSNLFIVKQSRLRTHPQGPLILPGITRHVVIELAAPLGLSVDETPFTTADLLAADELFLTGTTSEIIPYISVAGHPIGDGTVGPVTRQLQRAYSDATAQLVDMGAAPALHHVTSVDPPAHHT